jgi:hypothetical protein
MEEVRGFIFLGKGVEKLKGFTAIYLTLISAMLANVILNQTHDFYNDRHIELTLKEAIDFILSREGTLFITAWALIVGSHFVVVPIVMKALSFVARKVFLWGGNLFFYAIYFILTKILRLKAEKAFSFIRENELLNYLLYLLRVCHYKHGRIVRNRFFSSYKWYVLNIVGPWGHNTRNVNLTTAILISTLAVIHHYRFFDLAPGVYYIVGFASLFYAANAIIAAWVSNKSEYFLDIVANSMSYFDSLKLQPNAET